MKSSTLYYKATVLRIELNVLGRNRNFRKTSWLHWLHFLCSETKCFEHLRAGCDECLELCVQGFHNTNVIFQQKKQKKLQHSKLQFLAKRDQSWMQLSNIVDIVGLSKQCVCNAV